MKILALLLALWAGTAEAHVAIYCKKADGTIFTWLNFDGNGNPLVSATIRVKDEHFDAEIKPNNVPMRRQLKPLVVGMGPYTLTLGLGEKVALLSKSGEKQNGLPFWSAGADDEVLTCCNPRVDFQGCEGEQR